MRKKNEENVSLTFKDHIIPQQFSIYPMSDNVRDTSKSATQSNHHDAVQPISSSTTTTVNKTTNNDCNRKYTPGEVFYLYPHHYPQHTSTASGISMRGRRRPVGVSGRGGVSMAVNHGMPPRPTTSCRGGGTTKSGIRNPAEMQNNTTPYTTDKEEQDHPVQKSPETLGIEEEDEEEEEDDEEYKEEEESDDEGDDEKDEEEIKDEASSSFSNILVDHSDDEVEILQELRDLLEDYDDDWALFANHVSGVENSALKTTDNMEKTISVTHNKHASASSPLESEESHRQNDIEHKETYRDPNDACAASTLSTTSSLDTGERPSQNMINSNINTAASSNNKHNYPSVSAPPSPTIHNSTFRCPLDFIRQPPPNQPADASTSNQPQGQEDDENSTATSEPTQKQLEQLTHLLDQFYQVLLQQAVLTVRHLYLQKQHAIGQDPRVLLLDTATKHSHHPQRFTNEGSEHLTQDELAQILDGAVGMLQELDMLRKNALRNIVTFEEQQTALDSSPCSTLVDNNQVHSTTSLRRVLTRSLFMRTLQERYNQQNRQQLHQNASASRIRGFPTVFDLRGLAKLEDTFKVMDESVVAYKNTLSTSVQPSEKIVNILHSRQHGEACELLLQYSDATIDTRLIPVKNEISRLFTDPQVLLENNQLVMSKICESFTSSEDNLIVKGVNVFGEKAWSSISQRFLPDRLPRAISHRYTKLCILMYKACGIFVNDVTGELARDVDGDIGHLTPVTAPAKFSVNRWSFEEDILLLKAVPVIGHSWAEINSKWIKHRTRGHLRKRYQVLERRIKAGIKREASGNKSAITGKHSTKSPAVFEATTTSPLMLNSSFPKVKLDEKGGPDSTTVKKPSKKNSKTDTSQSKVLTAHSSMMPIAESKASYHPYPYYGTMPYYHPYFFPPHYPPGAINLSRGSTVAKSTEIPSSSTMSKSHTGNAKNDFAGPAQDKRGSKIDSLSQQNQVSVQAESDAGTMIFDQKRKNNELISGELTVNHTMKKNEVLKQEVETLNDKKVFSYTDAVEARKKSISLDNQTIDTTDSKTRAQKLLSVDKKGGDPARKSEALLGPSTLDPKLKKSEVHSQQNQTCTSKKIFADTDAIDSTVKKRKIFSQHNKTIYSEVISARTAILDTIHEKGGIISKQNGYSQMLSESGKISNPSTKCLGTRSLNISNVEHMLLCSDNKEYAKMPLGVRVRTSSEDDRSLLCYENEETLVKPLKQVESSDLISSASKKVGSPSASKTFDKQTILPLIEDETPSQLIDIPTQMLDLLGGEEASHIGIEKIIEENETKYHSVSFARLVESKKSGILNSGRDLTRTSTNFDDVRNALIQGAEEVSQLPQFTLEASGLSFLGPFEYNGKSSHLDDNICNSKSIYAKVLERATIKLPNDPLKEEEDEVRLGHPLSQSSSTPQIYNDEANHSSNPQCFDTTFANLTNDPPISFPSTYIGDIEFNDFACGEKTRDALELSSTSDRLQASNDFVYSESLDQYPVLSFERFDPVTALKSLGHPVSLACSSNLTGSTALKLPRQSLFASAVSAIQEKDEKKMKASKEADL